MARDTKDDSKMVWPEAVSSWAMEGGDAGTSEVLCNWGRATILTSSAHPQLWRRYAGVRASGLRTCWKRWVKEKEIGVRSCKPAIERLVDPMAHESPREVNEFLRVLETCRHPGRHRVPSRAAVGA
jgi:hypothetical protein